LTVDSSITSSAAISPLERPPREGHLQRGAAGAVAGGVGERMHDPVRGAVGGRRQGADVAADGRRHVEARGPMALDQMPQISSAPQPSCHTSASTPQAAATLELMAAALAGPPPEVPPSPLRPVAE
jgi:hypothetical protein